MRVLVVDDDPDLRVMLVRLLNSRGFIASETGNPVAAEEAVALLGAQIVLIDIRMPGLDGLELTRRLKERDPGTQIIIMTGYPTLENLGEARFLGAEGFLVKPFPSLHSVIDVVQDASSRIASWKESHRRLLYEEFPEESRFLYEQPPLLPAAEEIEQLLHGVSA